MFGKVGKLFSKKSTAEEKKSVKSASGYLNESNTFYNSGNYNAAIISCNDAIKLKPDYADAYLGKGNALDDLGRHEEAIISYNDAIKLKNDFATAYLGKGSALKNLGRNEEAIISYNDAIRIKPDFAGAWCNKGLVLDTLGRHEEAIISLNEAIRINPDFALAWINKGLTLSKLGRNEEAIISYNEAIKLKPDYAVAWYIKGNALQNLGRNEEAIISYNEAIRIKPDYADACCNKGVVLNDLGRHEEAITSYNEAIRIKPDYADAYFNKGSALQNLGRYEEAIISYNEAIKLKPDYALAYCSKGTVLNKLGKDKEALDCFNKAYELSQTGKVKAGKDNLSSANVEYINKVLENDREQLIKKLAEIQQDSIDIQNTVNRLVRRKSISTEELNKVKEFQEAKNKIIGDIVEEFKDLSKESSKDEQKTNSELFERIAKYDQEMTELKKQLSILTFKSEEQDKKLDDHKEHIDEHKEQLDQHGQKIKVHGKAIVATKKDVQLIESVVELDHSKLRVLEVKSASAAPVNLSPPQSPLLSGSGSSSPSPNNLRAVSEEVAKSVLEGIKEILDVNTDASSKQEATFVKNLAIDLKKYSKGLLEASSADADIKEESVNVIVRKLLNKEGLFVKEGGLKIDNSQLIKEGFLKAILESVNNDVTIHVNAVTDLDYYNVAVNHHELLGHIHQKLGSNAVNDFINFAGRFATAEDKELLETVLSGEHALENTYAMMGWPD